jgi:HK97 family phage prohead protease
MIMNAKMKKNINQYSVKSFDTSIKDLSLGKREVAFYLSKFDVIDSDNDMIVKGAFEKSIKERGPESESNRNIAFLRYHDWQHPIGKFLKLDEDEKGLFAVAQLGTSTKGEDALRDYEEGIIKEHSIGFQYITDAVKWVEDEKGYYDDEDKKGYYRIEEVKLFEGSAVTFGANEYTEVLSIGKSENKEQVVEKLSKEIDVVTKALLNGRGTDERLYNLEMKLKYLNSRLIDLAITDTVISKTEEVQQINPKHSFNWGELGKLLNI